MVVYEDQEWCTIGLYKEVLYNSLTKEKLMDSEWKSADEILEMMGITADEIEKMYKTGELESRNTKIDRRVCACGHRVAAHTEVAGTTFCKPARMECPCKKCRPVLEVDDTRVFMRMTKGGGALHALSQGLYALLQRGKNARWLIELQCDRCGGATDGPPIPTPVTQNGIATTYPTGFDALLCKKCREEI